MQTCSAKPCSVFSGKPSKAHFLLAKWVLELVCVFQLTSGSSSRTSGRLSISVSSCNNLIPCTGLSESTFYPGWGHICFTIMKFFLCTDGDVPAGQHSSGLLCECVCVHGLLPPSLCCHSTKGAGERGQAHCVLPGGKLASALHNYRIG